MKNILVTGHWTTTSAHFRCSFLMGHVRYADLKSDFRKTRSCRPCLTSTLDVCTTSDTRPTLILAWTLVSEFTLDCRKSSMLRTFKAPPLVDCCTGKRLVTGYVLWKSDSSTGLKGDMRLSSASSTVWSNTFLDISSASGVDLDSPTAFRKISGDNSLSSSSVRRGSRTLCCLAEGTVGIPPISGKPPPKSRTVSSPPST